MQVVTIECKRKRSISEAYSSQEHLTYFSNTRKQRISRYYGKDKFRPQLLILTPLLIIHRQTYWGV